MIRKVSVSVASAALAGGLLLSAPSVANAAPVAPAATHAAVVVPAFWWGPWAPILNWFGPCVGCYYKSGKIA